MSINYVLVDIPCISWDWLWKSRKTEEGSRSVGVTSGKGGGRLPYAIHAVVIVIVGPVM